MAEPAAASRPVIVDEDGELVVVGVGRITKDKYTPLQALERTLVAADLLSFADAVRDPERYHAQVPAEIFIVLGDDEDFDPYLCDNDEVSIVVDDARVSGSFELKVAPGKRLLGDGYYRLLGAPLAARGCRLDELEFKFWDGSPEAEILGDIDDELARAEELNDGRYMRVHVIGDTLGTIIAGARLARALLVAASEQPLDAAMAAHLVRAGMLEAVVGLPESEWLEVKQRGYQLSAHRVEAERHKLELAQDVARFANSDGPGLLLVGYRTRAPAPDKELVDSVAPIKLVDANAEQHRKVIDARVYPTIEGLRVDHVPVGDNRAVLVVEVPRQPEYLKPFLVHGAIVGERVDGSFVSIVRRRGSHSTVVDPSQLHAQLVAGRTAVRGRDDNWTS